MEQAYLKLAPNPDDFPRLVEKIKTLQTTRHPWPEDDIRGIKAPTLIVVGDSDMIRLEHVVEFFRLRGGGVAGDIAGVPASQLAVVPGTTHFAPGSSILDRSEWLVAMIRPFLE
jgi:pimeloyl-ACP methyl ester carboxylesterase